MEPFLNPNLMMARKNASLSSPLRYASSKTMQALLLRNALEQGNQLMADCLA